MSDSRTENNILDASGVSSTHSEPLVSFERLAGLDCSISHFHTIDSTNRYLMSQHQDHHLVIADFQTDGYGRKGDRWDSEPCQNLLFSYGFFCDEEKSIENLSLTIGAVIQDSLLRCYELECELKYPNDLLVNGSKMCGILIEAEVIGTRRYICIGVGMNVNADKFEVSGRTSMSIEKGRYFDRYEVLANIMSDILGFRSRFIV